MTKSTQYWPLEYMIPESEMTEHHRAVVSFMEAAYDAGFKPRFEPSMAVAAESDTGRHVLLVRRGRLNGYEPFMSESGTEIRLGPLFDKPDFTCLTLRPFSAAGGFVMRWLIGEDHADILRDYRIVGGRPFVLEPKSAQSAK